MVDIDERGELRDARIDEHGIELDVLLAQRRGQRSDMARSHSEALACNHVIVAKTRNALKGREIL